MHKIILVAGATGNLGFKIAEALQKNNVEVRAVVRSSTDAHKIKALENLGVKVYKIKHWHVEELAIACKDVSCVISALAGLRDVVIDAQKILLDAALAAKVPRFIPSDYSLDFTKFSDGENRNLDLRREFHKYLDSKPIAATSIFNGAFMDMLTKEMPLILLKQKMILYWGNLEHQWGFTTIANTASFTAKVALDDASPRYMHIAGDLISPKEIRTIVSELTNQKFKLFRPGGKNLLGLFIKIARKLAPAEKELYPAWQGMQYMHNMIDERAIVTKLDNKLYPELKWTSVKDLLIAYEIDKQFKGN